MRKAGDFILISPEYGFRQPKLSVLWDANIINSKSVIE